MVGNGNLVYKQHAQKTPFDWLKSMARPCQQEFWAMILEKSGTFSE